MRPKKKVISKFNFQNKIIRFLKSKAIKNLLIFFNMLNLALFVLIYNRQSHQIESIICTKIKIFVYIKHLLKLDIASFVINLIFLLETCLSVLSNPRSFFKFWQLANIFFVLCSITTLYLNVLQSDYLISHSFMDSFLISAQIFRFFLITKHVKFIKKFLRTFRTIIIKSFPIIILFLMILFFYGLIGNLSYSIN